MQVANIDIRPDLIIPVFLFFMFAVVYTLKFKKHY